MTIHCKVSLKPVERIYKPLVLALSSVFILSACSTFEEIGEKGKIDYKSAAAKRPTLEVPPDLTAPRVEDRASAAANTLSEFQKGKTAGVGAVATTAVLTAVPGVRVERAGTQRWLAVDTKPEVLWPVLRDFWTEQGFNIATESPQTGVMETDWAENRAKLPQDFIRNTIGKVFESLYSTAERDRFRVRIEAGSNGGSEIYLSHKGLQEIVTGVGKESTVWQNRPNDPDLEAEFLRRITIRLGVDKAKAEAIATSAKAPVAGGAASPTASEKAVMFGSGATMGLNINEAFDRSWRRVGLALDRVGFTVEDRDRSQGVYFVRYVDPELEAISAGKSGFLGRIFGGDKESKAKKYRIQVKQAATGSVTAVTVADDKGAALTDATDLKVSARMLSLLQEQLR